MRRAEVAAPTLAEEAAAIGPPHWRQILAGNLRRSVWRITDAPVDWPGVFACLSAVIFVRTVMELLLETGDAALYYGGTYADLLAYATAFVSWLTTLFVIAPIAKHLLRLDLLQTSRLLSVLLAVSWIVPPINRLAAGGSGASIYFGHDFSDFGFNFLRLFDPSVSIAMAPAGVRLEILVVMLASLVIAPIAFGIGPLRAVALAGAIYISIFALGYLPAVYHLLNRVMPGRAGWTIDQPVDYFLIYVPVLLFLGPFLVFELLRERRLTAPVVWWLAYPSRLGLYLFLTAFGYLYSASRTGAIGVAFAPRPLLTLAATLIAVALLFAWARIANDVSDLEIDRVSNRERPLVSGVLDPHRAARNGTVLLFGSLLMVIPAGARAIPLWLLIAALSYLYSAPPMRLRSLYPLGHAALALIALLVFGLGTAIVDGARFDSFLGESGFLPALFACFFFISHMKDLKDIHGDQAGGVYNVFRSRRWRAAVAALCIAGFTVGVLAVLRALHLFVPAALVPVAVFFVVTVIWTARVNDSRRGEAVLMTAYALAAVLLLVWLVEVSSGG